MGDIKTTRIALVTLFDLDFGARSISACLKQRGYPVSLIAFNRKRYSVGLLGNDFFNARVPLRNICGKKDLQMLIALLRKLNPAVIGISLTATTFQTAKTITLEIKKHLAAKVVWGGIHAIVCPEECIRFADIVCVGEGELPMLKLAEKLSNGEPVSGIGNLWIKNEKGIEKNEMLPLIGDLDQLPFPDFVERDGKFLIDSGRITREYELTSAYERNVYPIMTSRGCMYACSFCSNSILRRKYEGRGNYLRRRSVDNVIAELKYAAANRQFDRVRFWDDIFTYDAPWISDFCARYSREVGKPFTCYTHPLRTDREIMVKLRGAGLYTANLGIQSGSEEMSRNLFARIQSNQDLVEFARFVDKLGVTSRYDVIADNPYETDQDERHTAELLMQLPYPFQVQLYSLCWFPETPLTKKALEDKTISGTDVEQYTSKALNNFHMYISLSANKRSLFWNCIKGMAVNRLFPAPLIRACMQSRFLRKHPRVLFWAGKLYLQLRSRYSVKPVKGGIAVERIIPYHVARTIVPLDRHITDCHAVTGAAAWLFKKPEVDYSLFPLPAAGAGREICLRIRNHAGQKKDFAFVLMLVAYDDFFEQFPPATLWGIRVPAGTVLENDLKLTLAYPELSYSLGGAGGAVKLLGKGIPALIEGKIYSFVVRSAAKPYTTIDVLLFRA
ncbi:MAG: hypothetical protein A2285_03200 [Elusimicrobia bacterium RIFOXYA12_FULL_57_11]|nr:MAG: hypothetical protein A2285_03200 [Elusimicrobia bacterium RIFOXYA12_FULL_57_11]